MTEAMIVAGLAIMSASLVYLSINVDHVYAWILVAIYGIVIAYAGVAMFINLRE